ncbi:MAG: hypothetical protein AAGA18_13030 [Verrucomicrobiota bacterium]
MKFLKLRNQVLLRTYSRGLLYTRRAAFTLIEVVTAIGVLTFVLVSILSLLPIALGSAAHYQDEIRTALIAQMVFADIERATSQEAHIYTSGDADQKSSYVALTLSGNSETDSLVIGYDHMGNPIGTVDQKEYFQGYPKARYLAKIQTRSREIGKVGLCHITVMIQAPASAPYENRTEYRFVTLSNQVHEK